MTYTLYKTTSKPTRYIIRSDKDKKPCSCLYERHSTYDDLYKAIETKQQLDRDAVGQ